MRKLTEKEINYIKEVRKHEGIMESAKITHHDPTTVSKYAPTDKIEKRLRISAGRNAAFAARRARIKLEYDIRMAHISERVAPLEAKIENMTAQKNMLDTEIAATRKQIDEIKRGA